MIQFASSKKPGIPPSNIRPMKCRTSFENISLTGLPP